MSEGEKTENLNGNSASADKDTNDEFKDVIPELEVEFKDASEDGNEVGKGEDGGDAGKGMATADSGEDITSTGASRAVN